MAGCPSAVCIKSKAKSDLLEARVSELEKLVAEIHSRLTGCADVSGSGESSVSSKALHNTKVVSRASPGAEAGAVAEEKSVPSSSLEMTHSLKPEWLVVPKRRGAVARPNRGEGGAEANPIPVRNSFGVLSEDDSTSPVCDDVNEPSVVRDTACDASHTGRGGIVVVGSSNVRRILPSLRKRARCDGADLRVTSWFKPGGLVPNITASIHAAVAGTDCSRLRVVAHVGTNDASKREPEAILDSFRDLKSEVDRVRRCVGVDVRLSICSIVPRTDCGSYVWDRIDWLNRRLWNFCESIGAEFVDLRPVLGSCRAPLNRSGVHYTNEASERVARRIFEHCRYFLG